MPSASFAASAAEEATPSPGTGMPYASQTNLPSGAVRLVRLSALTASRTLRTASLCGLGWAVMRSSLKEFLVRELPVQRLCSGGCGMWYAKADFCQARLREIGA